jgi:hypothetical protein
VEKVSKHSSMYVSHCIFLIQGDIHQHDLDFFYTDSQKEVFVCNECPICLKSVDVENVRISRCCRQVICVECHERMRKLFKRRLTCPYCRDRYFL